MERFQTLTMRRGFKPELLIDIPPGVDENTLTMGCIVHYSWIFEKAQFYLEECRLLFESSLHVLEMTRSINDSCTPSSCPEMTAGPHYTYLWTDAMHPTPISVAFFILVHSRSPHAATFETPLFGWNERFLGAPFAIPSN